MVIIIVAKTFYFTSDKPHYPYQLPERWKWCKLEDIAELIEDCPHSTAKDEGQGFALIRTPNIGIGHLIFDNVHRVSKEVYDIRNARAVPQINDIIYAREAPAGNAAIINDKEKVCLGQRTVLIRPMQKWIDSMWLTYTINSPYARKTLISKATGSTVTHVNMENIRSLALPLPPLQEQSRIVESIEHWLSLVDCIEESNNNLQEAIRQTKSKILDLAIHGKLVPQDPTDEPAAELLKRINPKAEITCDNPQYGKLPKGWCETLLGNIGNWQSGATPSRLRKDYYNGDIHWLKTGDLNDGVIKSIPETITRKALEETSVKLNPIGSVLIAMYGATIGKIGILALPATTNQACCACVDYICDKMFLFYFLLANRERFIAMGGGGAQPNISKEKITNTHIPLPPLSEQHRIVAKIEELFVQFDKIESSL